MKKIFSLLAVLFLLVATSRAGIIFGSLSAITTAQTNSATFMTNTAYVTIPQIFVSNNGLAITNAYTGYFRFSIDGGTTFYTNNSPAFVPTVTNAATATVYSQTIAIPVLVQMLAITNPVVGNTQVQIGVTTP